MPSSTSGAIRQGRAFVELFTDDTQLKRGLRKAENTVKQFGANVSKVGTSMMTIGAAVLAPLGLAVRLYAKAGDQLTELSKRTGVSVETLSKLDYALRQNGSSLEAFEKGIRFSQKALASAAGAKALGEIGLSATKLQALSPEQQFFAIAEAISKIENPSLRAAAAMKLFGRGGTSLLPFLSKGKDGMQALMAEAERLGLVMTTQDAEGAHELEDALSRVAMQGKCLAATVGAALAPALQDLGKWLSSVIPQLQEWVKEHQGLIVGLAKTAVVALAVGAALFAMGKIILGVSLAFRAVRVAVITLTFTVGIFTGIGKAILFLGTMASFTAGAFRALRAAILTTEVAASLLATGIGLLVVGAIAAFLYFTGAFSEMGRVFKQVVTGMGDALAAGDIALAARILWAGLRVLWTEGINWILGVWGDMTTATAQAMTWLSGEVSKDWHWLCGVMEQGWIVMVGGLIGAWTMFSAWLQRQWAKMKGLFDSKFDVQAEITRINTEKDAKLAEIGGISANRWQATEDKMDADRRARSQGIDGLQQAGEQDKAARDAETDARRKELADLVAEAKAKKEAQAVSPTDSKGNPLATPDVAGSAGDVSGAFDVGAVLSLAAGDASSSYQGKMLGLTQQIADNTADGGSSDDSEGYQ